MANEEGFHCPACGNKDICFGYFGTAANTFVPSGVFTVGGFRTRAYVCLQCGTISQYIPVDKLEKLKEKFLETEETPVP